MDIDKGDIKRYGIFVFGLILSLGFAFGMAVSFSGMVDTGEPGQEGEEVNLPQDENFRIGSFELNQQAQFALAYENDIAFVNVYYENESQQEELEQDLEDLPEEFNDRVYVQLVDSDDADQIAIEHGITEYPAVIIVGANQEQPTSIYEGELASRDEVASDLCEVMRDWSGLGQCMG